MDDDFSKLNIFRTQHGIILSPCKSHSLSYESHLNVETGATVADLMNMDLSFWLLDTACQTQLINEHGIEVCGYKSLKYAVGTTLMSVSEKNSALKLMHNCQEVMEKNRYAIYDEQNLRKDGASLQFVSLKFPWYEIDGQIKGVFGLSIALGIHSLAENLNILNQLHLLQTPILQENKPRIAIQQVLSRLPLTAREKECLQLTVEGHTAKMIGQNLGLSFRTVEYYLNNIKNKLNLSSKTDLIEYILTREIKG